eukprot:scaffold13173_cov78-Cyclotella_meneghiniana.AAC.2
MLEDLEKKSFMGLNALVRREFMGDDFGIKKNSTRLKEQSVSDEIITNLQFKVKESHTQNDAADEQQDEYRMIVPNLADGTLQGKERLWTILQSRNITEVESSYWRSVPTWDDIISNLYPNSNDRNTSQPIIYGLETCKAFQDITSSNPSQRRIAPAGIFNTGTNYLSVLLEYNCQNLHRVKKFHNNPKRGHGNEWEVLWGKHTPVHHRGIYYKNEKHNYDVHEVLPIVLIRNPFGWMKSMCRNSYSAHWNGQHGTKCPELKNGRDWNEVNVKFGPGSTHHKSLAHMWNDWYGEYFYGNYNMKKMQNDWYGEGFYTHNTTNETSIAKSNRTAPFPRLMIRFEDVIFFPYEVTQQICKCAGGVLGHRPDDKDVANNTFHYVVRSAKTGSGHGPTSHRNGLIDSWVRYGKADPRNEYNEDAASIAGEVLDELILNAFGYG